VEKDEPEEDNPELLSAGEELIGLESRRSLIDEEIADEVLTVGGQGAIGGDEETEGMVEEPAAESESDAAEGETEE
jgi:hypothetical protein